MIKNLKKVHPHYVDGWHKRIIALIVAFYLFALIGAFFPSWEAIVLGGIAYIVTGFGVTVGYHRYFTHESFQTYRWVRKLLAVFGLLSGEGPPIYWVAWHRLHHQMSDTEHDPHSPHFGGFLHAHQLWMMAYVQPERYRRIYLRYAGGSLIRDKFLMSLNKWYPYIHLAFIVVLGLLGYAYGGWYYAASFVGYIYFVRTICILNATWCVNSLSHMYGSQPYKEYVRDESRNNLFVAVIALGEGWHHNHHVCPSSYRHGFGKWQPDMSAWIIGLMWLFHLAWDLKPFRLPPKEISESS